jgi:hypothetical protein
MRRQRAQQVEVRVGFGLGLDWAWGVTRFMAAHVDRAKVKRVSDNIITRLRRRESLQGLVDADQHGGSKFWSVVNEKRDHRMNGRRDHDMDEATTYDMSAMTHAPRIYPLIILTCSYLVPDNDSWVPCSA